MSKIAIKNAEGAEVSTRELNAGVFGIEPNVPVMHQVVRSQMAALRQGTHSTKTRGQVSGGGAKPWAQKGTGRARQGSTRSPQWTGGGTVFGPTPRDYSFRVNNKEVKLAMRSALSAKIIDSELVVVDDFKFEGFKTKDGIKMLKALNILGRVTIVIEDDDVNSYMSFRNVETARIIGVSEANTYDLLDNKTLLMSESVLARLEEVLA